MPFAAARRGGGAAGTAVLVHVGGGGGGVGGALRHQRGPRRRRRSERSGRGRDPGSWRSGPAGVGGGSGSRPSWRHFSLFPYSASQIGRRSGGGAVEPGGGSDRDGGAGRGSEVRAGPGGAEAAGKREAREGARAPPAGRIRSPAAGQGRGLAVLVPGTGVSDTATDTRLWAEAELLLEWRRVANSISKNPDGLYI